MWFSGKLASFFCPRLAGNENLPFAVARFFSYVSLVLVLGSSIVLALFIGNTMRVTLLDSQKEYALLLAQNLNKQIFRRFTLPVAYASGRVSLSDPDQYRLLDEVVLSLMHGLRIQTIRIYDDTFTVTYSTDKDDLGRKDLYTAGVPEVFNGVAQHFDVLETASYAQALLSPNLRDGSFQLRTIFPLSIDLDLAPFTTETPVLGALEIIQDVTNHYHIAIRSQWIIMGSFLLSSLILFLLFQFVARKAENILAERMRHNRQLEAELHQNEKLASMGRMVASIAHEIRNPLGIIRSTSEFLMNKVKSQPSLEGQKDVSRPMLEAIYDESCRLGATVSDFLDYAKPRQPRGEEIQLDLVLRNALAFLEGEFQRQGVLVHNKLDNLHVFGDSEFLYRAFYNILVNAQQAMNDGGEIFVFGEQQEDGSVKVVFQDTGPGFSTDVPAKSLDPFFTTKDTGTGLGLPIVQAIITSHRGMLTLDNAPEGGARITIVFPSNAQELLA